MMPNADKYVETLLAETRDEIAHADGKASILFGAGGVVFGVVAAALLGDGWRPSHLENWAEVVWWIGVGLGGAGLACLGAAVFPRIGVNRGAVWSARSRRPGRTPTDAARYFGDLAEYSDVEGARRAIEAGAESGVDRSVEQAWVLSKLVVTKYRLTQAALVLYAAGGACVLVAHVGS